MSVFDWIGDGPVEFPLLDERPLVALFVTQERVLEPAAEGAAEVHDRCRAGDGVVEVADGLGVGCIGCDPAEMAGVFASDLSGGEGGCEDVEVVCLVGRDSPDGPRRAPSQTADARDRGASRWLPGQGFVGRLPECCCGCLDDVVRFGRAGHGPFAERCRGELELAAGVERPQCRAEAATVLA